jgi:hypothetical protein
MLEEDPTLSFDAIAKALNARKRVLSHLGPSRGRRRSFGMCTSLCLSLNARHRAGILIDAGTSTRQPSGLARLAPRPSLVSLWFVSLTSCSRRNDTGWHATTSDDTGRHVEAGSVPGRSNLRIRCPKGRGGSYPPLAPFLTCVSSFRTAPTKRLRRSALLTLGDSVCGSTATAPMLVAASVVSCGRWVFVPRMRVDPAASS